MTEDGQLYENVEEMTDDRQKYKHNKMFEERCGIKRETITVVSLLFINLVIHCHRLALRNCVFSTNHIYLNKHLPDPENMKLHFRIIPEEITEAYHFSRIQDNNYWVYTKICKVIYGLKQAGIIANLELKTYRNVLLSSCLLHIRFLEAQKQQHYLLISS